MANNRVALSELSSRYPGALIVMEAGYIVCGFSLGTSDKRDVK